MRTVPALIIVYMNIPGMDGIETIEQLRLLHPATPLVLLTTSLTNTLAGVAIEYCASACFNKPVPF